MKNVKKRVFYRKIKKTFINVYYNYGKNNSNRNKIGMPLDD